LQKIKNNKFPELPSQLLEEPDLSKKKAMIVNEA
jgi:hypothetical protein